MARKRLTEGNAENADVTSDGGELFEDPEFLAHFEDAQLRTAILGSSLRRGLRRA